MTNDDTILQAANTKASLLADLLLFTKTFFKLRTGRDFRITYPVARESHYLTIARALYRVYLGKCNKLIINVPPRYSKTEMLIHFAAWSLANHPDSNFLYISVSHDLATRATAQTRSIINTPEYKKIFNISLRDDSNAKDSFMTTAGGAIEAIGAQGTIVGKGAGVRDANRFGGCFPAWQEVETENGAIKIGDIVNSRMELKVWSYNEKTKNRELNRINNYFINPPNDLIKVNMSDGSSFTCTPDHEILTKSGWFAAIHTAKPLNLMKSKSSYDARLFSCDSSVNGYFYIFFSVLWLCVPSSTRKILSDCFPSLSKLYLPDYSESNIILLSQNGSLFAALEYFNRIFSCELGAGSALKEWKCPVDDRVLHVVGLTSIREIAKIIVSGISIQMPYFVLMGSFAYKLLCDNMSNVFEDYITTNGKTDSPIAIDIRRSLKRSNGACPSDESGIRNLVKIIGSRDIFPVTVEYIGHVEQTFCIEVDKVNNFELSHSGIIASNCIIIDDIHKPDEATSDTIREGVINWFYNTLLSRRNNGEKTPIIYIGQRVHEMDLAAHLIEQGGWEVVSLPAIDECGHALCPDLHTIQELRAMQALEEYVFAAQFQQNPQPSGGGIFKITDFPILEETPKILMTFITADTAETAKEYNDATVFSLFGIYEIEHFGNKSGIYALHWLNCIEIFVEPKDLQGEFMSFYGSSFKANMLPSFAIIEKKSTGTTLVSVLKDIQGLNILSIDRTAASKSKTERHLSMQRYVANKQISLPYGAQHTKMCVEHMRKIAANGTQRRSDIADTLFDAVKCTFIDKTALGYLAHDHKKDNNAKVIFSSQRLLNQTRQNIWH